MALDISSVFVIGRLTRDARIVANGKGISFTVATSKSYKDKQTGEWINKPSFVPVTFWGEGVAKAFAPKLVKGAQVVVTGEFDMNKYKAQDGTERNELVVNGRDIRLPAASESRAPLASDAVEEAVEEEESSDFGGW